MNETHVAEADQLKDERVMRKKQIFRETKGKSDTENRCALYIIICLTRQIFFFCIQRFGRCHRERGQWRDMSHNAAVDQ